MMFSRPNLLPSLARLGRWARFGMGWVRGLGVAVLTVALAGGTEAWSQSTGPVRVRNQAFVDFLNPRDGQPSAGMSNNVFVTVAPLVRTEDNPGFTLVADRFQRAAPGAQVQFSHTLTNTGSDVGLFTLSVANLTDDSGDLGQLQVALDNNRNGRLDIGEEAVPPTQLVTLAPGSSVGLVVFGVVSPRVASNDVLRVRVTATLQGLTPLRGLSLARNRPIEPGFTLQNTDTVVVQLAAVQLFKDVSNLTPRPGDTLTYTFRGVPAGFPLEVRNVWIDGQVQARVVLRDSIPRNTSYVSSTGPLGTQPLWQVVGDAPLNFRSAPPADLSTVSGIGFAWTGAGPSGPFDASLTVRLNAVAVGPIANQARLEFSTLGISDNSPSNEIVIEVEGPPPTINYFRDETFRRIIPLTRVGDPLFIQATAGACNRLPEVIEQVQITVTSGLTGDVETYTATETGPNTGIFQILPPVPTQRLAVGIPMDGTLQILEDDDLTSIVRDCGGDATATALILVVPDTLVFASDTNLPVAGALVEVLQVVGGQEVPATVYDEDALGTVANTAVTGADGRFLFPLVGPGTYRLRVTPPANFLFPSTVPPFLLASDRRANARASYGQTFTVGSQWNAVPWDIPLDPLVDSGLVLEKAASRDVVEIGDSVTYTLRLRNTSGALLRNVRLDDRLPSGVGYIVGTSFRDGEATADPQGGNGPALRWLLGDLGPNQTTEIAYRARVAPGAQEGDGINRARAESVGPPLRRSNEALAQIRIVEGVFADEAILFGRLWLDADEDHRYDEGELGVPGVRLYLQNGNWVITDAEGQYTFYGLQPETHIVRVDETTLPTGTALVAWNPRQTGNARTWVADLHRHDYHRANFPLVPTVADDAAALAEATRTVSLRRAQAGLFAREDAAVLDRAFSAQEDTLRQQVETSRGANRQAGASTGTIGTATPVQFDDAALAAQAQASSAPATPIETPATPGPGFRPTVALPLTAANSSLPTPPTATAPGEDVARLVREARDFRLEIVNLREGQTVPTRQANVQLKGRADSPVKLAVNGVELGDERLGVLSRDTRTNIAVLEFIAVPLQAGANTLEARQYDPFGLVRVRETITITAPGDLGRIRLSFNPVAPPADGRTPVQVLVALEDAAGVPVTSNVLIDLATNLGTWQVADRNPAEPGLQVLVEQGSTSFNLLPPMVAGEAQITASYGPVRAVESLRFLPEAREFMVVGVAEGRLSFRDGLTIEPVSDIDGFERELDDMARFGDDDRHSVGGRAAFYLKGKVRGDVLLTAAYDSAKDPTTPLFRDIEPDKYYPIYGDDSIRGFDAQSTSRLYIRLDKGRHYFQFGDFSTDAFRTEARQIGTYNRSLTGAVAHYESENWAGRAFVAYDNSRQVVDELPANGTSGPYPFRALQGRLNSEVVEILTRDRNQPSVILRTEALVRYADYEFEPFTGSLLLRRPVATTDENFNPLSLRVTYEQEVEGDPFWIYGVDGRAKLSRNLEIGLNAAREEDPAREYQLASGYLAWQVARNTQLFAEVAQSDDATEGEGRAVRLELRHKDEQTDVRAQLVRADESFYNPGGSAPQGRTEGTLKATRKLGSTTSVVVEGLYSADDERGGEEAGVSAAVVQELGHGYQLTLGGRVSEETAAPTVRPADDAGPTSVRSVRARLDGPLPWWRQASWFGEIENDVVETDQRLVAAGGNFQLTRTTRLYARHEFLNSLGSPFSLNALEQNQRTLVGLETVYAENTEAFSEYRVRDDLNGREAEASMGLRNRWQVAPGLKVDTSFEHITPTSSDGQARQSTAATALASYTLNEDYRTTGRVEARFADEADSFLTSWGLAGRINDRWSHLYRISSYQVFDHADEAGDLLQLRFLAGWAWRPVRSDQLHALFRYEFRHEDGSPFGGSLGGPTIGGGTVTAAAGELRNVHIISSVANWQPWRWLAVNGRYAAKWVEESAFGVDASYDAHLFAMRATWDITRRVDLGLSAMAYTSDGFDTMRGTLGPELGFWPVPELRLSVGYNLYGVDDRDLVERDFRRSGVFLSFRLQFDEDTFRPGRREKGHRE